MILDDLSGALEIECAVAIVANPNLEANQPFSTQLHHVRDSFHIARLVRSSYKRCDNLLVLMNTFGSTPQFSEYVIKKLEGIGIKSLTTLVGEHALSSSALLPLASETMLLTPWATLGTIDPHIHYVHGMPKEALVLKEAVEQAMATMPKESSTGRGQVLYALSVSGALYEYVLAEKTIKYIERMLYEYVKDRMPEDKFNTLTSKILYDVDVHNQPMSAEEIVELIPYAKIVDEDIADITHDYIERASRMLIESGKALLIETTSFRVTVSTQGQQSYTPF